MGRDNLLDRGNEDGLETSGRSPRETLVQPLRRFRRPEGAGGLRELIKGPCADWLKNRTLVLGQS